VVLFKKKGKLKKGERFRGRWGKVPLGKPTQGTVPRDICKGSVKKRKKLGVMIPEGGGIEKNQKRPAS